MRAREAMAWNNAAWSEAERVREALVDVDHQLLGLVAAGGPAARLLARHGLTLVSGRRAVLTAQTRALALLGIDAALPVVAPRPTGELQRGASTPARMTPRAWALFTGLERGAGERDYLAALLAEPSGTVRDVLAGAGVDVGALERALVGSAVDWRTPAPRRVPSSTPARRGRCVSSLRLEHWISAPHHLVHRVAADPGPMSRWPASDEGRMRRIDGRHDVRVDTGLAGRPLDLVLTLATPDRVRWEMWWRQCYGGSHTLDLQPCEGGTMVKLTREITTFGHLAAMIMPYARLTTGLGMPTLIQDLSLACADVIEGQP